MTINELIAVMLEADPTGQTEVSVGNKDIYFAEMQEAYWDGRLQRLIIDESKKPFYSVVGARVVSSGRKLTLHTMGVQDVLENDPDAEVDLSDLKEHMPVSYEDWRQRVETWREETRRIEEEIKSQRKGESK